MRGWLRSAKAMKLTYDLHIHSCLSPCGDDEMTPANIAGMAALKGLSVIALTDHNTCRNCPALLAAAQEYGILALPGMEINTSEEVHALCLFPTLGTAMDFDAYVYEKLIKFPNNQTIFGKQQIYNCQDQVWATEPNLLMNATALSFGGLWELVRSYGGVMFPAHLDKPSNSLLSNLGFIPPDSKFRTAEVKDLSKLNQLRRAHPYLEDCRVISSSDAHVLEDISEPGLTLEVEERTAAGVIRGLLGEYE